MITTALRLLDTLRAVPPRPPGITAEQVRGYLVQRGWDPTLRTVQRDLAELSATFPLGSEGDRPMRWFWMPDAASLTLPGLDVPAALTWRLLEEHVADLLPLPLARSLEPQFREARKVLKAAAGNRLSRWLDRVRAVPRALPMRRAEVRDGVLEAVHDSLLHGHCLNCRYRSRSAGKRQDLLLHPLGLVVRDTSLYLLARDDRHENVIQLAMQRLVSATPVERRVREPEGFSLDAYIAAGGFGYGAGERVDLEVEMDAEVAYHLAETPIDGQRAIEPAGEGRVVLRAHTLDTLQLRWWLRALGPSAEVLAPPSLREAMGREFAQLAASYANPTPRTAG